MLLGPFGSRTTRASLRVLRSLQDHPSSAQEAMWAGDGTQAGHILVMLLEVPRVDDGTGSERERGCSSRKGICFLSLSTSGHLPEQLERSRTLSKKAKSDLDLTQAFPFSPLPSLTGKNFRRR